MGSVDAAALIPTGIIRIIVKHARGQIFTKRFVNISYSVLHFLRFACCASCIADVIKVQELLTTAVRSPDAIANPRKHGQMLVHLLI
jgi:hypothetical protein